MTDMNEPPYARQVLTSPLHLGVAAESRTNLWTIWNGFTTPSVLTRFEDEEHAFRGGVVIGDISPLHKCGISGADVDRYLSRLIAGFTSIMAIGEIRHVVFCEDHGLVVGDGDLFRIDEQQYFLVTDGDHFAWLLDSAAGLNVKIENLGTELAGISLMGPLSRKLLEVAGIDLSDECSFHSIRQVMLSGISVCISRMGRIDPHGYELWMRAADGLAVWNMLMEKGQSLGLRTNGFSLREMARIEAGVPKEGLDYVSAFSASSQETASSPFDLGLLSLEDIELGHFTGCRELRVLAARGPRHSLVRLRIEWPEPLSFTGFYERENLAGVVTSLAYSPGCGFSHALARVFNAQDGRETFTVRAEKRRDFSLEQISAPVRVLGLLTPTSLRAASILISS